MGNDPTKQTPLPQPTHCARGTVTTGVVLSKATWACNSCNQTEVPTWDLVACRQHWHPSQSSGQHRWCPRVHWSTAPHYCLQPTAQHLPKRKKKSKLLFSDGGFRWASLELHLAFLIPVSLVLSLKWLVWRRAGRGTFPVPAVAAREDGWCYVLFKATAISAGNLASATAPRFSFCEMGMILHATSKRCMEMADSQIPSDTPLIYFPLTTSPTRVTVATARRSVTAGESSLISLRKASANVNALSIPTAPQISTTV